VNRSLPNIKILDTPQLIALGSLVIGIFGGFLSVIPSEVLGFSPTALGWVIPFTVCLFLTIARFNQNNFPILIWLPWVLYTTFCYVNKSYPNAFQRLVMFHVALIIGIAFSTMQPSEYFYMRFTKAISYFFWLVVATGFVASGLLSGSLNPATAFAAGSITATLLATWYAGKYSIGDTKALKYWVVLCLIPVLSNTRTGIIAVALTLPLTFGPLPLKKRMVAILLMLVAGAFLFQTERVQQKMFYSGHGDYIDAFNGLVDLISGSSDAEAVSGDFATNGRKAIGQALKDGLDQNYWTGNGANASEQISMDLSGVSHPHNEYLRVQYEYGMLGMIIFIVTVFWQCIHAYKRLKKLPKIFIPLFCISIGAFMPMFLFMASDNILLYVAWYGNLQFAALGMYYAILGKDKVN
jgi:O-antigen ligase